MKEHTPTPWFHDRVDGDSYSHISSKPGEGGDIATAWVTGDVNAAFIVKAVNSHDQLVDALESFVGMFGGQQIPGTIGDEVLQKAKAALASLKERP